jgi:acyl-CoA synthetase
MLNRFQATPTLVSSFGASLLRHTLLAKYSSLRVLSLGGEQCPDGSTLQLWREDGNKTLFINIYGVTEVSCWAMWYQLTDNDLR